jgi:hypothetical protein
VRHLAGNEIGLIALRDRDQQIGVLQPGTGQHRGIGRIADHRLQVEAIL